VLWPADNVWGKLNPLMLNPEPVTGAWVIVTVDPPLLVKVSGRVWLWPSWTVPKFKLAGRAVSAPGSGVSSFLGALLNPWQPIMVHKARNATTASQRVGVGFIIEIVVSA
jgi:hypothetical protein